ncbi:hypothetical protein BU23DRAFT_626438 [Bimuria novae-zelandiae CBS 107.79]|uniref:Uncharacterized protein n=1 Tax=Bimuria novae-zelandiae CBS 107.79 TaxID=1447943 RepID=A0A6A5VUG7_9PLEO|nr:hypothetical protein BU23DRAFT_626438 [Bimuria novae-zelandiae CBS 107.79]
MTTKMHLRPKSRSRPTDSVSQGSAPEQTTVTVTAEASPSATALTTITASSPSVTSPSATPTGLPDLDHTSIERVKISCPSTALVSWKVEGFSCLETTQVSPDVNTDITGITASTPQTCIDACSTWNQWDGGGCLAVSMEWDLSYAYREFKGANCFLRGTDSPTSGNPNVTSLILDQEIVTA